MASHVHIDTFRPYEAADRDAKRVDDCFLRRPAMALFVRQVITLTLKNLLLAFIRRWFSTTIRAFLLPAIFVGFLCVGSEPLMY